MCQRVEDNVFHLCNSLPPDEFKLEYGDSGVPSERWATYDLQQAGFLVFQVDHRLAPPGALTGQHYSVTSGRFPEQTDDIKRQIMAALADSQCNGKIYLVGGSAGGCLALWVMLDSTGVLNLGWNDTARSKIKAVVSLSGPADLCDWSNPGGIPPGELTDFENVLDNYVGLPPQTQDCSTLDPASPAWLVSHGATSSPPVMLYATDGDTVPNAQATDMYNALKLQWPALEAYKYIMHYTVTDPNRHSYKYWHSQNNADNSDGNCVSYQVLAFLQAHP